MKDHRFIELVNLYIDRQITAAETAELEAEIQNSPRRRAVYRQYCQMNHATTLVFDRFRSQAPDQPAAASSTRSTIARFESQRRGGSYRWAYYASGFAAAACLALIFARLSPSPSGSSPSALNAADSNPVAQVAATLPQARLVSTAMREVTEPQVRPLSLRNVAATGTADYAELLAALLEDKERAFANGKIQSSQLPSLFEDGKFESRQVFPVGTQRTFRSRQTSAQQAEFTAFQFQR